MDSRFIFHPDNYKNINITHDLDSDLEIESKSQTSLLKVTSPIIKSLHQNHRKEYQDLAKKLFIRENNMEAVINYKTEELFPTEEYDKGVVHIVNGITNPLGVILTETHTYLNGGCLCNSPQYTQLTYKQIEPQISQIPHYKNVITIAALWAGDIWHFPSEAFVALMCISEKMLNDKNTYIHVSKKSSFVLQWLSLLHIEESRVIDNFAHAEHLYIPRMGKCGNPYKRQIIWMTNILQNSLPSFNTQQYVILVKRNQKRPLQNFEEVKKFVYDFANKQGLTIYEHDDSNLPPLKIQQQYFNQAKYVFAPHGAAGIHLYVMKPESYYVEFLDVENMNVCYMRLAHMLNVHYIGVDMTQNYVNMNALQTTVDF